MKHNVVNITEDCTYVACIPIPSVTNNKVFIPTYVIQNNEMRFEDIAVYGVLCGFNGKASLKQLKSRLREPIKDILISLRHLVKLGYISVEYGLKK